MHSSFQHSIFFSSFLFFIFDLVLPNQLVTGLVSRSQIHPPITCALLWGSKITRSGRRLCYGHPVHLKCPFERGGLRVNPNNKNNELSLFEDGPGRGHLACRLI